MRWISMAFILISAAVAQLLLPACAFLGHTKFPLLLSVVLYYALCHEVQVMLTAAFFAGFLHDVLSPIPLGYSVVCFCVAGWIASRFRKLVLTEFPMTSVLFGAVGGAITTLGFYILLIKDGLVVCPAGWVVLKTAGAGILGIICAPAVFFLAGSFDRLLHNIEVKENIGGIK